MKRTKLIVIIAALFVILLPKTVAADYSKKISYNNYILVNMDTQQVLLQKDARQHVAIASLTKMMTVLVALENNPDLNKKVTINEAMITGLREKDASVVGFVSGEKVTIKDLIYGALLPSGADAARALAIITAKSEGEFVKMMNLKAAELGMNDTLYKNSTGLDKKGQYSCAYDQMVLLQNALQNPVFTQAFTAEKYKTADGKRNLKSSFRDFLKKGGISAPYIKGAKTGYETLAGVCLASYVELAGDHLLFIGLGNMGSLAKARLYENDRDIYTYYIDKYDLATVYDVKDILYSTTSEFSVPQKVEVHFTEPVYYYLPNDYNRDELSIAISEQIPINYHTKIDTVIAKYSISYKDEVIVQGDVMLGQRLSTNIWLQAQELSTSHPQETIGLLVVMIIGLSAVLCWRIWRGRDIKRMNAKKA